MNNFYEFGINILIFLQSIGSWLIPIMKIITFLGNEEFYLLVTPILYWCIDTTIGIRTAILLMGSSSIFTYLKWLLHQPRPYWISAKVFAQAHEPSFGLPSGHAQNSAAIWGTIAYSFKRKWLWILAIILMFLIGISRLFLGVHFPHDVLLGWFLGFVLLLMLIQTETIVVRWFIKFSIVTQFFILFLISILMASIGYLIILSQSNWNMPGYWLENITLAFPENYQASPFAISSLITLSGSFFGLTFGHTLSFSRFGYNPRGTLLQFILRYLIGVFGIFAIYTGLRLVFPYGENMLALVFRYIRYFLVGFWVTYLAPVIFIRIGLAAPLKTR